jgi:hypothetical protein
MQRGGGRERREREGGKEKEPRQGEGRWRSLIYRWNSERVQHRRDHIQVNAPYMFT